MAVQTTATQAFPARPGYCINEPRIEIRIGDRGGGIPEQVQPKIFEHLLTAKGVGKGMGLRLALARQVVAEKHSGQISVFSAANLGSKFTIVLPVVGS